MADPTSVQVAVRVRPLVSSEVSRGCKSALNIYPDLQQVQICSSEKSFSFNYVFDSNTDQEIFYGKCVQPLVPNLFKGYNVTILAYGQTGSGKTHSMGTAYKGEGDMGVIPRAVDDIFKFINDNFSFDFTVTVSFMELYQEILYDLLSTKPRDQCIVEMREDVNRGIFIPGLTEQSVTSPSDTMKCLLKGSQGRATASTNMNSQSSRSHAIFTITIAMQTKGKSDSNKTAKFHLVDLAGSERSKKTGATGQTFKEGVNINKGLLALGNVISALGDEKGQQSFIAYRDSNLTRLLKDSLGGNSITLMIACISPADYNIEETVSTLRYADRARKIKNKPIVNEDPKAAEINRLNKLVQKLRMELVGQGGPVICQEEMETLKKEILEMKLKNTHLTIKLSSTITENAALLERILIMQSSNECLSKKLNDLKESYDVTLNDLNVSLQQSDISAIQTHVTNLKNIQDQFKELDKEHKKNEDEIRMHEMNAAKNTLSSNSCSESEINERQESHATQQIELNHKLQEITKILAQKEDLALQIAANTCHMVDFEEISANEAKIESLQKEKDELLQQLKTAQTKGPSNKLAEQRRKRVQELEGQIHDLNRKVQEQARLIKLKEKDEQKIRQLNSEIQNMKGMKVKLIKNMRQESERFRTWKIQRERDLAKLKDQDRKRQNQIVKMETIHTRQQNVLKRKVEEAAAINKRLKDALAVRKACQDTKMNGKIERFGPWVQRELDVFVSTIDAQATLDILLEHRASLQQQLDNLKNTDSEANESEIGQLEEDIEMRSAQIQEIQQKILDSDEDNKSKSRFDNIQTMGEAKYTLKALFDLTADIKRKESSKEYKLTELQNAQSEMLVKLSELEATICNMQMQHQDELAELQRENEEKIAVLLRQLRGIESKGGSDDLNKRCEIQFETIEKLENEKHLVITECDDLKRKIKEIEDLLAEKTNVSDTSTVVGKRSSRTPPKVKVIKDEKILGTPYISDTSFEEDNNTTDPDWRNTPLAKRIREMRSTIHPERLTIKRNSQGGCSCRGTCGTRTCGCRKFSTKCGEFCMCPISFCVNRDTQDEKEENSNEEEMKPDIEFKKPIPLQEHSANELQVPKKTRRLFK